MKGTLILLLSGLGVVISARAADPTAPPDLLDAAELAAIASSSAAAAVHPAEAGPAPKSPVLLAEADAATYDSDADAIGAMATPAAAGANDSATKPEADTTPKKAAPPREDKKPGQESRADLSDPGAYAAVGAEASAGTHDDTFDPDPGAGRKSSDEPFYQPPPGTPPDYGSAREPLLDQPHAPLLDIEPALPARKVWQNRPINLGPYPPGTTAGFPDAQGNFTNTAGGYNRWYPNIPAWRRYNNDNVESPYMYDTPRLWDPYKMSELKGDTPVLGNDIFLSLIATNFTSYEARDIPTPAGVSTSRAGSSDFFGQGNQMEVDEFATFSLDLFKGETVFQPVTWDLHIMPVYNINYSRVQENGILSVDPRGSGSQSDNGGGFIHGSGGGDNSNAGNSNPGTPGNPGTGFQHVGSGQLGDSYTTRTKDFASLEQAFLEFHIADLSDNYDFVSIRLGNQPFNADFRGFVFNDTNLGVRVFGNYDSNRWQYNLAAFDMREKDTYSELNTFDSRNQYVFIANLFRQDFLTKGYTGELSFLTNLDDADEHYDRTGNIVRPAAIGGPIVPHDIRAYYLGFNGDGHIGRVNITNSFYDVFGRDTANGIAGQPADINAQMAAVELSYDQDWVRFKASFFYASGDDNPTDGHATGFDTIVDNPNFIGGPFSYYARQGFIFGDTAVNFKQPTSLVLDLRSSKNEGQANFVNPGVFIYGVGTEMTLTPTLKLFLNANYIRMVDVQTVDFALHTANVTPGVGYDLSGGIQWRPLLTENVIVSAGLGSLIPLDGYRRIYETNTIPVPGYPTDDGGHVDSFLYSGFASVTLTY
jgi:hypothetical protein